MLKISLAQINPTIGDIDGNIRLMLDAAHTAQVEGASMVIFPELSLTGYYPGDMLEDRAFIQRIERGLEQLKVATREFPDLRFVVGAPTRNSGVGKPLFNSLLVLLEGEVLLTYHKQLLPTYNVFDEHRHLQPGPDKAPILDVNGTRVGFLICEDGWNDDGRSYLVNPFERLSEASPDVVVSINASPSDVGKREIRHTLFTKAAKRHYLSIIYVNQVGGHDQLVYDGGSFAVDPARGVVFEAPRFEEAVCTLSLHGRTVCDVQGRVLSPVDPKGLSTCEFYRRQLELGLKDYVRRCGFKSVVVGSSGGIDSALTLALAAEALGPENVVAVTMPSMYSSTGSVTDSERLCHNLGIKLYTHPIAELVNLCCDQFERTTGGALTGLSKENLQARLRGLILMEFSNKYGHLLLTTGNKSEISVGYCTLYGDTNGGLGLIGDLYKTEVFALSRYLNERAGQEIIPNAIIEKPPSAELAPGQKDTDSLPPYEVLDEVLKVLIEGSRLDALERERAEAKVAELSRTPEGSALIERVKKMIARNEYKRRQAPPILRVRARAFGSGRQMPIAAHYE